MSINPIHDTAVALAPKPASGLVASFLRRLAQLSLSELGAAIHTWRAAVAEAPHAWFEAEEAVASAISAHHRHEAQELFLERIADVFRRAPWFDADAPGALIRAAEPGGQYVATLAMLALLVSDRLTPERLCLLYRPFARSIPIAELRSQQH
jgi:hypothetical protein